MFHQDALWSRHGRPAKLHFSCVWWDCVWQLPLVCLSPLSAVRCHPVMIHNSSAQLRHKDTLSKHGSVIERLQFKRVSSSTVTGLCRFKVSSFIDHWSGRLRRSWSSCLVHTRVRLTALTAAQMNRTNWVNAPLFALTGRSLLWFGGVGQQSSLTSCQTHKLEHWRHKKMLLIVNCMLQPPTTIQRLKSHSAVWREEVEKASTSCKRPPTRGSNNVETINRARFDSLRKQKHVFPTHLQKSTRWSSRAMASRFFMMQL